MHTPTRSEVDVLAHNARELWRHEPSVGGDQRVELMTRLHELRSAVEHLARRIRHGSVSDIERRRATTHLAAELRRLQTAWV